MTLQTYRGRKAAAIENRTLRVTVLAGGGHVAEILHKPTRINPLWAPPWPTIEPSSYNRELHPKYGSSDEAHVLSGIMGHNVCLDTYGSPSPEEFAAGVPVHGEGPIVDYELSVGTRGDSLSATATLPLAELRFSREIRFGQHGQTVHFAETLENLSSGDRPISWMQHVTLGPPFLERGRTQFRASVTKSKSAGAAFADGQCAQAPDAEFEGLACPRKDGGVIDLRLFPGDERSAGFTSHLVDPRREDAFFAAWSPTSTVLFGYVWKRRDFPWLCRWEENHFRADPPWLGQTLACGMEFGLSPTLGSRKDLVTVGSFFDVPVYRWIPAKARIDVEYCAFAGAVARIPEDVTWRNDSVQWFE